MKREETDRYTMEILNFEKVAGGKDCFTLCVDRDKGVRLFILDMQNLFDSDFSEYLERLYSESEEEFAYTDSEDQADRVIPVSVAIDMVYSMPEPDRGTLGNMLSAIEDRLVHIW